MAEGFEKCDCLMDIIEKLNRYSASENVSAIKGLNMQQLSRIAGVSWEQMRACMRALEKLGIVERFGAGKYAMYSIKLGKNRVLLMP